MNLLSLVMGLLLIFTCTFSFSLSKAMLSHRIAKTYEAHGIASRKIRNSYENLCYRRLRGETKEKEAPKSKKPAHRENKKIELANLECARINLWPLILDGKEKHQILYETAAQILRSLYSANVLPKEPRFEYRMLDAILIAARDAQSNRPAKNLLLEKLCLKDLRVKPVYTLQSIYYRMLRGTKKMTGEQAFPSLLEYMAIEEQESRICIHHASIELLRSLFGPQAGAALYQEIRETENPLTQERVQEICSKNGKIGMDEEFLKLFDWHAARHHGSGQKTIVREKDNVCLKQKVFLPT